MNIGDRFVPDDDLFGILPAPDMAVTVGDGAAWRVLTSASGRIGENLSVSVPGDTSSVRIRVREVEMIGRDTNPVLGSMGELDERVVFTDTVELQPA